MTNSPDHYCPYFLMFSLYRWVSEWPAQFTCPGCATRSTSSDLSQLVSNPSVRSPGQPAEIRLTGWTRLPNKCKERAEKRKAEQQERGQEPGIKRGRLIHTSRITASQTERSLSVADTTEVCSLSPPSHLHTHCPSLLLAARRNYRAHCCCSIL